jgi:hypothetical protein
MESIALVEKECFHGNGARAVMHIVPTMRIECVYIMVFENEQFWFRKYIREKV